MDGLGKGHSAVDGKILADRCIVMLRSVNLKATYNMMLISVTTSHQNICFMLVSRSLTCSDQESGRPQALLGW